MLDAETIEQSADGRHCARLMYEGETRYGPRFYRLVVDDQTVPDRVFGEPLAWSACGTYLAAQEWLSTDYGQGPQTRLLLIDVGRWSSSAFQTVRSGFAQDFDFRASGLRYAKVWHGTDGNAGRIEVEVEYDAIRNWSAM